MLITSFCLFTFSFLLAFGVWCNASIRVLGTRGDSSTLSSPTTFIAKFQLPIFDWPFHSRIKSAIANQKSAMPLAPVAQMEERDASNVEVAGPSPARSSIRVNKRSHPTTKARVTLTCATSGSDVAGNMRVFQTRFESSSLSFRSNYARVAKRLRRRIANPVFVSSSLTARSKILVSTTCGSGWVKR